MLLKQYKSSLIFILLTSLFYLSFAYDLNRNDYIKLISLYVALFVMFYKLIQINKENFTFLAILAFSFRVLFLFATPNLSQDFYRFIWDGRMILQGFNPYLSTPESFILNHIYPIQQAQELYNGMGILNGSHFTNYPPLNQLCFVIAGLFAGKSILGSVIVMRLIIISADFGTLYFGKKLLEKLNIPVNTIFWYILNPFIIIELTGNLHFESVMIFFLVWSLYLLHIGKWHFSAIVFACSISVKLIPLIFLPVLFQKLSWKKSLGFYTIIGFITLISFVPFITNEFIMNYFETVGLWFQRFEFNASLYYIARSIGYTFRGYNEIAIIGKFIPILVILLVLIITFFRKNKSTVELISALLFVLAFYYFTATTVHPWYVATLLILSIFTKYKFPLVWSFVGILSYLAYTNSNNTENLYIIGLEYLIIYSVFIWEVFVKKATKMAA
ncbi:mannosyltransferase [Gaetbulibacter sp. M235]|uniref:mannosyltransferase n=1 Tax=Gaetbulibacter sp. M235 TaxID=3126510 RepID=UPI00374F9BD5